MSPWPTMTIMCFPFSSKKLNQSKLCFVMLNLTIFVVLTCLVKYTWRKRILANIQTSGTWVHVKKVIFCNTRYPIYPMILKINWVPFGFGSGIGGYPLDTAHRQPPTLDALENCPLSFSHFAQIKPFYLAKPCFALRYFPLRIKSKCCSVPK